MAGSDPESGRPLGGGTIRAEQTPENNTLIRITYLETGRIASPVFGLSPPPRLEKRYTTQALLITKTLALVRIS